MSRLTDLMRGVAETDAQLASDLAAELKVLAERRAFGLNFERHTPESVELPGRRPRKGDKVRLLPDRGAKSAAGASGLWQVAAITGPRAARVANVVRRLADGSHIESTQLPLDDVVVVAEFRDPIYPGLVSTGTVERGGKKAFHTVINGENFHALQALLYTHEAEVDVIYIDPPYNSGARDWKYNNDYVDSDDTYRHSKWLAFMERRLVLARRLLNPSESVLIVAIDEKEYLRLGLLLEQIFPAAKIRMVSTVINPKGTGRAGDFARTNEYLFFVLLGSAVVGTTADDSSLGDEVTWETMRRRNLASVRGRKGKGACGPDQFYPIFVDARTGHIGGRGKPLAVDQPRQSVEAPEGTVAVFPVRPDGTEMNWEYKASSFDAWWSAGYIRANGRKNEPQTYIIQHLPNKVRNEITSGVASVEGKRDDGSAIARYVEASRRTVTTQWSHTAHSAEHGGTGVLKQLIPTRQFPFPKSLYAVEDALRLFTGNKSHALIVDFFGGSGTTAHAVMRLNKQDDGQRRSITITNNEVSAEEQEVLRRRRLRPGDDEWETHGICEWITKARLRAAVTGRTPAGDLVQGLYKFGQVYPMAEGFEENIEFFTLSYESPRGVAHNKSFEAIAPLLWLKSGARGRRIDKCTDAFDLAETYGVLFDLDASSDFLARIQDNPSAVTAFIVTDDDRSYQMVCSELGSNVSPIRLYESYLTNFTINTGRE